MCVGSRGWSTRNQERVLSCICVLGVEDEVPETRNANTHIHFSTRSWFLVLHPLLPTHIYTTALVPGFWYFILYSQHTYTRQHTFLVSGTSSSTPNTHIHDSTRSWFLVLHPLLPTHIYTIAHVPCFWYLILYSYYYPATVYWSVCTKKNVDIKFSPYVSGICSKPKYLKCRLIKNLGNKKIKRPYQDSQILLRSLMPEDEVPETRNVCCRVYVCWE
jgi:hypothetical protein